MSGEPLVNVWASVDDNSTVKVEVLGSGVASVEVGTAAQGFELEFEPEALRRLVDLGAAALTDMDQRFAEESAIAQGDA